MKLTNINTAEYWNNVYRAECESGKAHSDDYSRDYGPIHDEIVGLIPGGSSVLDIACGPGLLCRKIRQRLPSSRVVGIDFSEYMIAQNRRRDHALGIDYRCVDIREALATVGGTFDVVTMCEILEHLDEPEGIVRAAFSLLKTGGRFILTCPHDDGIPDPEHVRTWGHDEVFHLLAPYSSTVSFMHFPGPYFHPWMLAYLTKSPVAAPPESTR